jgi:hypothetical protein
MAMPVIRISERTWERLKRYAEPLVHTPDDVVNMGLDALEAQGGKPKREGPLPDQQKQGKLRSSRSNGLKLPQKEFRLPLLETLYELGGAGSTTRIRKIMEMKMAPRLREGDYAKVSTGDPRWWNAICWERNDLVKEGFIRSDSARGSWELTAGGIALAEKSASR